TQFGGFVARYVGDGILVYFGWPRASEADAEQALRGALAAAQAVAATPIHGNSLSVRIGIATGLVVVGERLEAGEGQEQTATGETPNRAARLQALAEAGGIVIDAATRRSVGELFDVRAMGQVGLKGFPEPIEAFEVQGEQITENRFDSLRAGELTGLVGRQEELDILLRRWRQAREGQGRVVLICGEPGIGKSRLLAELVDRLSGEAIRVLRLFCWPHTTHTPLFPIIRQVELDARLARDKPPAERSAKLRSRLEAVDTTPEDIALITALLHLPCDHLPSLNLSPQRRKERTFAALLRRVECMSVARPLVIVFEDVHWADPSTREMLDDLIRRVSDLRILLVLTFRPEFVAPWAGHAGVTSMTLSRLERAEAVTLAQQLATRLDLPGELLDQIATKSDGVPLFIEELTKAVIEAAPQVVSQVSVPATLQASLIARLDRMPPARQVAQIGSVFGRQFPRALLGRVADMPPAILEEGLDQLVAAGLLFRRGEGTSALYLFKHALVQEAAYDTLLRSRRAGLHAAIASALEGDAEIASSRPALLAHHFAQAGDVEKASLYFLRAGEQSAAASAMNEADAHLRRGLALAADVAGAGTRSRRRAELTLALGNVRLALQGIGSPAHKATFAEAAALCRTLAPEDPAAERLLARALFGHWSYELQVGELARALEVGQEFHAAGRNSPEPEMRAAASGYAVSYMFLGRLEEAVSAFAPAIADAGIRNHTPAAMDFGFDPTCHLYAQCARSLVLRGYADQARVHLQFAIDRAHRLQHLPTQALTMMIACTTAWNLRDFAALRAWCGELVQLASEQHYGLFHARGLSYAGWIRSADGAHEDGLAMLDQALRDFGSMRLLLSAPHTRAMRSDVFARMRRIDCADADLDDALAICARTGETWPEAELRRRKGALRCDAPSAAEACFRRALTVARSQGARLLELRAAVSLARLWQQQGMKYAARDMLAPVHAGFTEG
ncbi:MAG: AAA family ATPase, partial [Alphaproteobacteria bacterium]|nr:AAA family ATPase [Alphaproteobacteria bacterium]